MNARYLIALGALAIACAGLSGCDDAAMPVRGGLEPAPANAADPPGATAAGLSAPAPQPEVVREATFDDITLELEKDEPFVHEKLTDTVRELDGKKIRIRGYILPSFQQTGIRQFVLVRDNLECCFGPGAALFDCIVVEMQNGASTEYSVRPVAVEGRFQLKVREDFDGRQVAIYQIDGESVQ
jgi:hypothetical protein